MTDFNPNLASPKDSGIFGLPYSFEQAALILLPIPWEVTTSYGGGTSLGPQAIFHASKQIDLFDFDLGNFFHQGIHMLAESKEVQEWNAIGKNAATQIIENIGVIDTPELKKAVLTVNEHSKKLNNYVYNETKKLLAQNKIVGLVGGDHSTPYGTIQAHLEKYPHMGILHIDAHADLREAFEGFEFSHASIMHNVMTKTNLQTLVQVGIRDFCQEEFDFIKQHKQKITTFFDAVLAEQKIKGKNWDTLAEEIINCLPKEVYISFDIDGLDPRFCPHTGTPVPGGLDISEAFYLIKKIKQSGRIIIGFDLNEVAPKQSSEGSTDEWDANVAARLLYKLCGWTLEGVKTHAIA